MLLVYLLSTITLVFVLICLLDQKKSDPQPKPPQPLQPWTGDELSLVLKMLKSKGPGTPPDDVLECIVSNLSRVISYKDLMSKSEEEQKNLTKKAGNICLLGVKGKWTILFKGEILNGLMKKMNGGCALCMLEKAEQNYDPTQINENNLPQIITSFMTHCKDYCTH